jgi:hypothetical protein
MNECRQGCPMRLRELGMDTSAGFTHYFLSHNHATLTGWRIARSQHVRFRQKWSFGNGSLRRLDMLPPHRSSEQEKHHRGVQEKRRNDGNTGAIVVLGAHNGSQMLDPVLLVHQRQPYFIPRTEASPCLRLRRA